MDALEQLLVFLKSDPANKVLALDLLDRLLGAHRLDEARTCFASLDASLANDADVLFRHARLAMLSFDFETAIVSLHAVMAQADDPAVRHDLAFCQLSLGQLDAAETTLLPLVGMMGELPAIGFLNARLLHYRARYGDAVLVAEAACEQHPTLAEGWGILAMARLDAGDTEAAATAAARALAIHARQPDALTVVGSIALQCNRPTEAASAFDAVLDVQPSSGRALAGAGEACMLRGDMPKARQWLTLATHRSPQHIGTWHALAWSALLEGDLAAASAAFDQAMAIDRNFGETHGGVALVHILRGKLDEGRVATRRALRLDPASRNGRYAQSLLWQDEGKVLEAHAMVDGILSDTGVDPSQRPARFIELLRARLTPTE